MAIADTIYLYENDCKVRIPDDFSDVTLQKKCWRDLERGSREQFWNYILSVEFLPDVSDAFLRNIFARINRNSRKLMAQEMRHAKYDGWLVNTAENEAEKQEWKNFGLSTAARIKRMADVQFISELFRIVINKKIEGFDQNALDDLYAEFEDLSDKPTFIEDEFREEVEFIKSYISDSLLLNPYLLDFFKVQAHFYSVWGYVCLNRGNLLKPQEFGEKLLVFMKNVVTVLDNSESTEPQDTSVIEYAANIRGASTDLTPRLKRSKALLKMLHGIEEVAHEDK